MSILKSMKSLISSEGKSLAEKRNAEVKLMHNAITQSLYDQFVVIERNFESFSVGKEELKRAISNGSYQGKDGNFYPEYKSYEEQHLILSSLLKEWGLDMVDAIKLNKKFIARMETRELYSGTKQERMVFEPTRASTEYAHSANDKAIEEFNEKYDAARHRETMQEVAQVWKSFLDHSLQSSLERLSNSLLENEVNPAVAQGVVRRLKAHF